MCKSSCIIIKKEFGTQSIEKETPATSYRKKQRKNRLRFAKKYKDLSEKEWEDYVFSDESPM